MFIGLVTLSVSNIHFIQNVLFVPSDFKLGSEVLASINALIELAVGERAAGSLSLAIFWALVGMFVYALIWLISNFSTELSNDLAITKYIHPRGVDPSSPLRDFISRTIFRTIVFIVLLFYLNAAARVFLPLFATKFRLVMDDWPQHKHITTALIALAGETLVLHGVTILFRLELLKKRVFGD